MTVLLVEDNPRKTEAVLRLLAEVGVFRTEIQIATSMLATEEALAAKVYDVMILDVQLPEREGGVPNPHAGIQLVELLSRRNDLKSPSHVIGLTEFADSFALAEKILKRFLFTVVLYDEMSDEWRDRLGSNLRWIRDHIEVRNMQRPGETTLAIVCAIEELELHAVVGGDENWVDTTFENDPTIYRMTKWVVPTGEIQVVAAAATQMGMVPATLITTKLIQRFSPKFVAMTGICAGMKGTTKIGDIVVADETWDYSSGKIRDGATGLLDFDQDLKHIPMTPILKNLLQKVVSEQQLVKKIDEGWAGPRPSGYQLRCTIGPMASGPFVVANEEIATAVKRQSRKVAAIEMEAAGVMYSAHNCTTDQPLCLVVKSVADYGDSRKRDKFQRYAAYSSAGFLRALFASGILG